MTGYGLRVLLRYLPNLKLATRNSYTIPMPVLSHIVACKRNERIARDIYEIVFEKPAGFDFLAGQYVLFDVPHLENPGDMQTRAFSIASSPD